MSATKVRLVVVGGFLGAGKTTGLLRLAQGYDAQGLRVGLITNDQADGLVDTGAVRLAGFAVQEVAGACFCCKFDDLAQSAETLRRDEQPHVILGEPVGSCTDLAATVVSPFRRLYGDRYEVAPYSVLVDPVRARQIVLEKGFGGFSPKVAYIFAKQLEEADVIGLNKADLLAGHERELLLGALRSEFPKAQVLALSGLTGEGFDAWRTLLDGSAPAGVNIADVDYDTYAEGEAELGWLNLSLRLSAAVPFDADALLLEIVRALAARLAAEPAEIAHLKALCEAGDGAAIANAVGTAPPRLGARLARPVTAARLVLNARVHLDPERLRGLADAVLAERLGALGIASSVEQEAQFRPGRPVPIHRDAVATG